MARRAALTDRSTSARLKQNPNSCTQWQALQWLFPQEKAVLKALGQGAEILVLLQSADARSVLDLAHISSLENLAGFSPQGCRMLFARWFER
jgi:hypothetical protein